jgi:hypothetical protein
MHRKDYIKAAELIKAKRVEARGTTHPKDGSQRVYEENVATEMEETFIQFFSNDNPRFDKKRFSQACQSDVESLV